MKVFSIYIQPFWESAHSHSYCISKDTAEKEFDKLRTKLIKQYEEFLVIDQEELEGALEEHKHIYQESIDKSHGAIEYYNTIAFDLANELRKTKEHELIQWNMIEVKA